MPPNINRIQPPCCQGHITHTSPLTTNTQLHFSSDFYYFYMHFLEFQNSYSTFFHWMPLHRNYSLLTITALANFFTDLHCSWLRLHSNASPRNLFICTLHPWTPLYQPALLNGLPQQWHAIPHCTGAQCIHPHDRRFTYEHSLFINYHCTYPHLYSLLLHQRSSPLTATTLTKLLHRTLQNLCTSPLTINLLKALLKGQQ